MKAECRKVRYLSRRDAREALDAAKLAAVEGRPWRQEQRAYPCYPCMEILKREVYHLTSQPLRPKEHHESESSFVKWCVEALQFKGWLVTHVRPGMTVNGEYRTMYEGDDGLPDLIALRGGVALLAECKSEDGRIKPNQQKWLDAGARLWRPSMRTEILREID